MSELLPTDDPDGGIPRGRTQRSLWFGLVWAIPLAALIIVAFLGLRAWADKGIDVVVTFESSAGARVNDTKVIYRGIEAGHVRKIEINPDGRHVDMTLRLDPRSEPILTTEAQFWLIGAKPDLNDISSVKAALAGLTIGVAPGMSGPPARHFVGLNQPPIIMPGTPGTNYVLDSEALGTAHVGSPLYYRGQEIGKVTAVRFTAPVDFKLDVFVMAPYDKLIRPAALFWISSPVQVSLSDKGANATLSHASALLSGAIEFDLIRPSESGAPSPAGTVFSLYGSRSEAETGPGGPEVPYAFRFRGPAGELPVGAPVRLLGFQVGAVKSVRLEIDGATGLASSVVVAALYPRKMHIAEQPASGGDWRGPTDAAVSRLLGKGHRARLIQSPPLIGGRVISLDAVRGAGPAALGAGEPRSIPSDDSSGGIDEMTGQVNQMLATVNRIPFDAIGHDVREMTRHLSALISSPELAKSLQHLNSTMEQVDRMINQVGPQVGPLVAKLNSAADEVTATVAAAHGVLGGPSAAGEAPEASLPAAIEQLSESARSIRTLADYLVRHPEALIRGRTGDSGDSARKEKP